MAESVLNMEIPEKEKYNKLPYDLIERLSKGRRSSRVQLAVAGKIHTFSVGTEGATQCYSKYKTFAQDFRVSRRSVARALKSLREEKLIENAADDDNVVGRSAYRYIGEACSDGYIRMDLFLFQREFTFKDGGKRYLTFPEILVFSYILSNKDNPNAKESEVQGGLKKKYFDGSVRSIAKKLCLAPSTAQCALGTLIRAGLIKRTKGTNGSVHSHYYVNVNLIRKKQREQRKADKAFEPKLPKAVLDADAKAERESYYAKLREAALRPAEQNKQRMQKDPEYKAASLEVRRLESAIGKADALGQIELMQKLQARQSELKEIVTQRLAAFGMTAEDLQPRYRCLKCSDTGFLPNGVACSCYPKGRQS